MYFVRQHDRAPLKRKRAIYSMSIVKNLMKKLMNEVFLLQRPPSRQEHSDEKKLKNSAGQ
jgi:hypothetical protein